MQKLGLLTYRCKEIAEALLGRTSRAFSSPEPWKEGARCLGSQTPEKRQLSQKHSPARGPIGHAGSLHGGCLCTRRSSEHQGRDGSSNAQQILGHGHWSCQQCVLSAVCVRGREEGSVREPLPSRLAASQAGLRLRGCSRGACGPLGHPSPSPSTAAPTGRARDAASQCWCSIRVEGSVSQWSRRMRASAW